MKKVGMYIKNVGKSVQYSAIDAIKDMAPSLSAYASTNNELFKEISDTVRNRKIMFSRARKAIDRSKIYAAGQQMKVSLMEDIASGTFYNKERKSTLGMAAFNDDDFGDFNFDSMDDMGATEFDSFDEDGGDYTPSKSDRHISDAIESNGRASAEMISTTIAKSSEYIIENQRAANEFMMMNQMQTFGKMTSIQEATNSNIGKLVSFNMEASKIHYDNSKVYYETTTNLLKETNALMKEFVEMERNRYGEELKKEKEKIGPSTYDDVVGAQGEVDIKEYFKLLKKNLKTKVNDAGGGVLDMLGDQNIFMSFAESPLEFVPKMLQKAILGPQFEASLKRLDKSVSKFFGSLILKFNSMAADTDAGFLEKLIGTAFGINNSLNTSIDSSRYKKGAMPWDGVAKKALTEVIPAYLSQIVSLLSGKPATTYDYANGKYVEIKNLKKDFDSIFSQEIKSSMGNTREAMEKYMDIIAFNGQNAVEDRKALKEDMDKFFKYFFDNGVMFDYKNKDLDDYGTGIDNTSNRKIITEMFKSIKNTDRLDMNESIMSGRADLNKRIKRLEEDGTIYSQLFDNNPLLALGGESDTSNVGKSKIEGSGGLLISTTDKYNHNIFYYLRQITSTLLTGIKVYNTNGTGKNAANSDSLNPILSRNVKLDDSGEELRELNAASSLQQANTNLSEKEKERLKQNGQLISYESITEDNNGLSTAFANRKLADDIYQPEKKKSWLEENLIGSSLGKKFKAIQDKIGMYRDKPMSLVTNLFDSVDRRLHDIIFGTTKVSKYKGKDVRGFMDMLMADMSEVFEKFNKWLDENILKPLAGKLDVKKIFGKIGSGINNFAKDVLGIDSASLMKDLKVTLFGKDDVDADGNLIHTNGIFSDTKIEMKNTMKSAFDSIREGFDHIGGTIFGYETHTQTDGTRRKFYVGESLIDSVKTEFSNVFSLTKDILFGGQTKGKSDKQIKLDFGNTANSLFAEFKDKNKKLLPKAMSGAAFGAGFSLLPGIIGGPLLGAAFGTGISLIKNSDTLMDAIFGKKDESGERVGTKLAPKSLIKAFEKYSPDMKKFGISGALLSIMPFVPGGPIAGMMLGSAFGFAKNNAGFQKFMFGDGTDTNKGLFGPNAKANIDKFLPKAITGGILGGLGGYMSLGSLFGGPFGMLGGAALGAGIGLLTTTDKFKTAMLGTYNEDTEQNEGGVLPMLRDTLVKPIQGWFGGLKTSMGNFFTNEIAAPFKKGMDPFIKEFQLMGKSIKETFSAALDKVFTTSFGAPLHDLIQKNLIDPFKNFFTKIFTALGKIAGSIISSPFKAFGYVGDSLRAKHIKGKNATYMKPGEINKFKRENPGKFPLYAINRMYRKFLGLPPDNEDDEELSEVEGVKDPADAKKPGAETQSIMKAVSEASKEVLDDVKAKINKGVDSVMDNENPKDKDSDKPTDKPSTSAKGDKAKDATNKESKSDKEGDSQNTTKTSVFKRLLNKRDEEIKALKDKYDKSDEKFTELQKTLNELLESNKKKEEIEEDDKKRFNKRKQESMADNVALISAEVKGQLDGVGYNLETIKNILEDNFGAPENEATGSRVGRGNRKRKGLIGQFFEFLKNPVGKVKNLVHNIFVGKDGESGIFGFAVKGIKNVFDGAIKIITAPFKAIQGLLEIAATAGRALIEGAKMIGPAIGAALKTAVKMISVPIEALGHVIVGFGKGAGEAIGSIVGGLGKVAGSVLELTTVIPTLLKTLVNFAGVVGGLAVDMLKFVGAGIGKTLGLGADLLFGGRRKKDVNKTMTVTLNGGHLDYIGRIGKDPLGESKRMVVDIGDIYDITITNMAKSLKNIEDVITGKTKSKASKSKDTPVMTTEFGAVRYDVDESGIMLPIEDAPFMKHQQAEQVKKDQQASLVENIAKSLDEQKGINKNTSFLEKISKGFETFFNKFGLIALGIAGAIAAIANFDKIKETVGNIWGFLSGEDSESRKDEKGNTIKNYDLRERGEKFAAINTVKGIRVLDSGLSKGINTATAIKNGAKKVTGVASDIGEAAAKKISAKVTGEAVEGTAEKSGKKFMEILTDFILKFFSSKKVQKEMGKVPAEKAGKKIIGKIGELFTNQVLKRFFPKISLALARFAGETAAEVATAGIGVAVFGVWDFSTGIFEADRLFKVDSSQVDWKMRTISSILKGTLGLGNIVMLLDIASEIVAQLTGFDLKQTMATMMYKSMSNDVDDKLLAAAQSDFMAKYEAYKLETGNTDMSIGAYNDMVNKTVGGAIMENKLVKGTMNVGKKMHEFNKGLVSKAITGLKDMKSNGGVIGTIVGLNVKAIKTNINTISKVLGGVGKALENNPMIKALVNLNTFLNGAKDIAIDSGKKIASHFMGKIGEVFDSLSDKYGAFRETPKGKLFINSIGGVFDFGWQIQKYGLSKAVSIRFIEPIKYGFKSIGDTVTNFMTTIGEGYTIFRETEKGKEFRSGVLGFLVDFGYVASTKGLKSAVDEKLSPVTNLIASIGSTVSTTVSGWSANYAEYRETPLGKDARTNAFGFLLDFGWLTANKGLDAAISDTIAPFKGLFTSIMDGMRDILDNFWESIKDTGAGKALMFMGDVVTAPDKALGAVQNIADVIVDKVTGGGDEKKKKKGWFGFGKFGRGPIEEAAGDELLKARSGAGTMSTGFTRYSQQDPRWKNIPYGYEGEKDVNTIGNAGCGPVTAAMVASTLSGTVVSPEYAAKYAIDKKYKEVNGGTKPEFFPAYLKEFGITTSMKNIEDSRVRDYETRTLYEKLYAQKPVIFMGKDSDGNSTTPFGSAPHYVVATGVSKDGKKAIVVDPADGSSKEYDFNSMLKKSSYSIATFDKASSTKYATDAELGSGSEVYAEDAEQPQMNFIEKILAVAGAFVESKFNGSSMQSMLDGTNLEGSNSTMFSGIPGLAVSGNVSNPADDWFLGKSGFKSKSSPYGYRNHPETGVYKMHNGIDYAAPEGKPIMSPVSGKVVRAKYDSTYGNQVQVVDEKGNNHQFAHMSKMLVKVGDTVKAGQTVGLVGTTGSSTGNHLHYTVSQGAKNSYKNTYDPNEYFRKVYAPADTMPVASSGSDYGYGKAINAANDKKYNGKGGDSKGPDINKVLLAVIDLLMKVVGNTDKLGEIVKILSSGLNINLTEDQLKTLNKPAGAKVLQQTINKSESASDSGELLAIYNQLSELAIQ